MKTTLVCQHCNEPWEADKPWRKYCSKTCSNRANAMPGNMNPNWVEPVTVVCASCGLTFTAAPSLQRKYCSRACLLTYTRTITGAQRYNYKGGPEEITCEVCGTKRVVRRAALKRARTCSKRCSCILGIRAWPRRSSLETAMDEAFERAGLTPQTQYAFDRCTFDFAFPEQRLAIECDGVYWHGLADVAARDRRRDYWLRTQGWSVVRLGEVEIRQSPEACAEKVKARLMRTQDYH